MWFDSWIKLGVAPIDNDSELLKLDESLKPAETGPPELGRPGRGRISL